ncbi:MAG: hypothetical protein WAN35_07730 [Terracidiphilus sp.]
MIGRSSCRFMGVIVGMNYSSMELNNSSNIMSGQFAEYFVRELSQKFVQPLLDAFYSQYKVSSKKRLQLRLRSDDRLIVISNTEYEARVFLNHKFGESRSELTVEYNHGINSMSFTIVKIVAGYNIEKSDGHQIYIDKLAELICMPLLEKQVSAA